MTGLRAERWRIGFWCAAAVLLAAPWLATRATDQVAWSGGDFALLGALLGGVGILLEIVMRKPVGAAYRAGAGVALAGAFLLVVVTGAVGVIGSADNDANLMYAGVLAVGAVGALLARFRPLGMARALIATATAQVLVAAVALVAGFGSAAANWPLDLLGATAVFTGMWGLSARLFRKAATREPGADGGTDTRK